MGAQATDAALNLKQKVKGVWFWTITMLLGRTPQRILPAGNEPEPTRLLAQWFMWNVRQRWRGADGFDYLAALPALTLPTLMFAGGNDLIAPASGCRKFFDAMGSSDKTWLLCARSAGFSKDYSHADLVIGRPARAEIFPRVGRWLQERNNAGRTA
jgi:pimeloyl-ACP methyl ester carboxylesterase